MSRTSPPARWGSGFRPHEHLRRPADFKRVYDRRRSASQRFPDRLRRAERPAAQSASGCRFRASSAGRSSEIACGGCSAKRIDLTRHQMPTGLDLILIPRIKIESAAGRALMESLPKLVGQVARKLARNDPPPRRRHDRLAPPSAVRRASSSACGAISGACGQCCPPCADSSRVAPST